MIFEYTRDNIMYLMSNIEYASISQLIRFFSDTEDRENVSYYIKKLIAGRDLVLVNADRGLIKIRKASPINDAFISARVRAFWLIAEMKSRNITDVFRMQYPSQLGFITANNECYDITICDTLIHAQLAKKKRDEELAKGTIDQVSHIAIVRDTDIGNQLAAYGFDTFCLLDAEHKPSYYYWS